MPSAPRIGTPTYAPIVMSRAALVEAYSGTAMASGAICGAAPVTMYWQNESDQGWEPPVALP